MREDESYAGFGDIADLDLLSPDSTAEVKSLTDLWSLARAVVDTKDDPIWEALYSLNCNPKPLRSYGYSLSYCGYRGVYFPKRADGEAMKFSLVRLAISPATDTDSLLSLANSLMENAKFSTVGREVWITCECDISADENPRVFVGRVLSTLKSGADMLKSLSARARTSV